MTPPGDYRLIDFGDGRKLEQFGPVRLDRPCPVADRRRAGDPAAWAAADARFDRGDDCGGWTAGDDVPDRWQIDLPPVRLELKRSAVGHLGFFPEHAVHWPWLADHIRRAGRPRLLNLFGYTGATTLVAAAAGAEVVHVDAARNVIAWARRNAELSNLAEAPIRWIVDDAPKFVRRERARGSRYDGFLLDPPSYGHGARGEVWRLSKHLEPLLVACGDLVDGRPVVALLTCHTPGYEPQRLGRMLAAAMPAAEGRWECGEMTLADAAGRTLPCGTFARLVRGRPQEACT